MEHPHTKSHQQYLLHKFSSPKHNLFPFFPSFSHLCKKKIKNQLHNAHTQIYRQTEIHSSTAALVVQERNKYPTGWGQLTIDTIPSREGRGVTLLFQNHKMFILSLSPSMTFTHFFETAFPNHRNTQACHTGLADWLFPTYLTHQWVCSSVTSASRQQVRVGSPGNSPEWLEFVSGCVPHIMQGNRETHSWIKYVLLIDVIRTFSGIHNFTTH